MNIKDFFGKMKENEFDLTIRCKGGSMLSVSGDGVGGLVTPETIQNSADSIKKKLERNKIGVNKNASGAIEMKSYVDTDCDDIDDIDEYED